MRRCGGDSLSSFGNTTYLHAFSHYFGGFICFIIINIDSAILINNISIFFKVVHPMYVYCFCFVITLFVLYIYCVWLDFNLS